MTPSCLYHLKQFFYSTGACLLVLVSTPLVQAQLHIGQTEQDHSPEVEALVRQLASVSFAKREEALRELQALDYRALPKLEVLQASTTDLEVRTKLKQLVLHLERERFEELSKLFLQAEPHPEVQDLYCWQYYSSLLGDSRTSKILFLEMSSSQPQLAQLVRNVVDLHGTQGHALALEELNTHVVEQALQLSQQRLTYGKRPEIGEVAGILVAATVMSETPIEVDEFLETCAHVVPVTDYMRRRGYQDLVRMLYNDWLPKSHEGMSFSAISIAMRMDLSNGAVIARRCLDPKYGVRQRQHAIECLARFGDEADLPALAELLRDKTICQEFPERVAFAFGSIEESRENPPGVVEPAVGTTHIYRVRICDMSLAAILSLYNEDLQPVFPKYRKREIAEQRNLFNLYETAVATDEQSLEDREKQLEAYRSRVLGEVREISDPDPTDV